MLGISSISDTRIMNITGLAGMEHQNLMLYSQRLKQLAEKVQPLVSQPSTQTKILKLEQETIGSNLIDGVWMPGHYSLNR